MAFDTLTTGRFRMQVEITATKAPATGGPSFTQPLNFTKFNSYTLGSGALAINNGYCAVTTLSASANTTLDLSGSLTDLVNGGSLALTGVKLLAIVLLGTGDTAPDGSTTGTAANSITFGNASAACLFGFGANTHTWSVNNGDFFMATCSNAAGWAVTNSTADGLKLLNNDSGVSAKVLVIIGGIS